MLANPRRCWNWFLPAQQRRSGSEPAAILALVEEISTRFPVDRERVFVLGLSAGGAMAAILAEQAPDIFAGVGIMAGVALHAAVDAESAFSTMAGIAEAEFGTLVARSAVRKRREHARLRAILWTGEDDKTVAPINTEVLARQFATLIGVSGPQEIDSNEKFERELWFDASRTLRVEARRIKGFGHAWSGGSLRGSFTDPSGPDASREMIRFFLGTQLPGELISFKPSTG